MKGNEKMQQKQSNEKGMLTVEAVLSLVPFIMVILGIISFINIFMIHNKIQFAMQQMGNELSCYTYFYQAFGIRAGDRELNSEIDIQTQGVDQTIADIDSFLSAIDALGDSVDQAGQSSLSDPQGAVDAYREAMDALKNTGQMGKQAVNSVADRVKDPRGTLRGLIYLIMEMGEEAGKSFLLELISPVMINGYLDTGFLGGQNMSGDEYLRYFGVQDGLDGLDFGNSSLFSKNASNGNLEFRMIDIVLEYDIEVYILKLFLKDPTIHVVQRCTVPAWLDGDGQPFYTD